MRNTKAANVELANSSKRVMTSDSGGTESDGASRSPADLRQEIAVTAYFLAERRNFEPGHDADDWFTAEAQVLDKANSLNGFST